MSVKLSLKSVDEKPSKQLLNVKKGGLLKLKNKPAVAKSKRN